MAVGSFDTGSGGNDWNYPNDPTKNFDQGAGENTSFDYPKAPKFEDPRLIGSQPQNAAPIPQSLAPSNPLAPRVPGITPPVAKGAPPQPKTLTADQIATDPNVFNRIGQSGLNDIGNLQSQQMTLAGASANAQEKALNDQQTNLVNSEKQRTKLLEDMGKREQTLTEKYQNDIREADAFAPTKQSAAELAQMFGLMTIATFGSGGMGKYHGLATLSAMSGLSQGFKEGNIERFNKEKANYEENLKQLESHNSKVEKTFNAAMEALAKDKELGEQKIKELIAIDNSGPIAALARAGKYDQVSAAIDTVRKSLEKVRETQQKRNDDFAKLKYEYTLKEQLDRNKLANKTASDRYGFGDIVVAASNEAAATMSNLMLLPFKSKTGMFANTQTNTLFTAPFGAMANKITDEDAQIYNVESRKLAYNLAQLMSGGRAVRQGDVGEMVKVVQISPGDTLMTAATKIAEARQIAERTVTERIASPNTPKELKEVLSENVQMIKNAVPFTVNDINNFRNAKSKKQTFGDVLDSKFKVYKFNSEADMEAAHKAGTLHEGDNVVINGVQGFYTESK
jgi:hypothetical protein